MQLSQKSLGSQDTYEFGLVVSFSNASDSVEGREYNIGSLLGVSQVTGKG